MFYRYLIGPSKFAIALSILISNGLPIITAHAAVSQPQSEDAESVLMRTQTPQALINMSLSTLSGLTQNPALTTELDTYLQAHYGTGRFMGQES